MTFKLELNVIYRPMYKSQTVVLVKNRHFLHLVAAKGM